MNEVLPGQNETDGRATDTSTSSEGSKGPRVFISYAHHESAQIERTIALARCLSERGVDVRMDVLDPQPDAGWPLWMEQEIEKADRVLIVCTTPWVSRFEGRRDGLGGYGVAWEGLLIRKHAYAEQSTSRYIVVRFLDDLVALPTLFSGLPSFVLDDDLDRLVEHLAQGARLAPPRARTADAWPVLEWIDRAYAVVFTPDVEDLAARVAASLGARSHRQDADGVGRELARAAVVVALGDRAPLGLRRLCDAPDRRVVASGDIGELQGTRQVPLRHEEIVRGARRSLREVARAWWRRAGLDVGFGLLLCGSGPLAAMMLSSAGARRGWLFALGVVLAGACWLLSAAARTAPDGRVPAVSTSLEWTLAWRWLGGLALAAISPLRRREIVGGVLVLLACSGILFAAWMGTLPPLSRETATPLLLATMGSMALGAASLTAGLRLRPAALVLSFGLTVGGQSLSSLVLHWGSLLGGHPDELILLLPTFTAAPQAWLFAGPASTPWVLAAALFVWTGILRFAPRRAAITSVRLRAMGAMLALLALALAW